MLLICLFNVWSALQSMSILPPLQSHDEETELPASVMKNAHILSLDALRYCCATALQLDELCTLALMSVLLIKASHFGLNVCAPYQSYTQSSKLPLTNHIQGILLCMPC